VLAISQIAEKYLRHIISEHEDIIPTILEIPSKETPYEAKKAPFNYYPLTFAGHHHAKGA